MSVSPIDIAMHRRRKVEKREEIATLRDRRWRWRWSTLDQILIYQDSGIIYAAAGGEGGRGGSGLPLNYLMKVEENQIHRTLLFLLFEEQQTPPPLLLLLRWNIYQRPGSFDSPFLAVALRGFTEQEETGKVREEEQSVMMILLLPSLRLPLPFSPKHYKSESEVQVQVRQVSDWQWVSPPRSRTGDWGGGGRGGAIIDTREIRRTG